MSTQQTFLSERVEQLQPSATLKISGLAKEMKRAGKDVISLSAGEPDFPTPDYICKGAIEAINSGFHGYTMNTGTPELRQAIVEKLKTENGLDYDAGQIVCSNGAKQSIGFSLLATINEGEEVIIPAPYWVSYPEMAKLAQGKPIILPTLFEHEYKLKPEDLEKAINEKTKMLILCTPSNPTGSRYSAEELSALADVLRRHPHVLILSDEIYEYIIFDGEHVGIVNVAPDLKDRTILINGFSKGFAMTGWRLGYLAATPEIAAAVAKIQSQETSAPSSISQKAGETALTGDKSPLEAMKTAFKQRRDYVISRLNAIEGVKCFNPGGAFYAFPDISAFLPSITPNGMSIATSTELCVFLLEQALIALVPGDAFGEPNGLRLSYASSMEQLESALDRFEKALSTLKKV